MSTTTPETPQPQQPPPQGALSGALSSLVAVGQYASRACAAVGRDFATLFARGALPAQRIKAASGLALTAVIVAVLGYAALQEWQIHIIYGNQIAHGQAEQLNANPNLTAADIARGDNLRKKLCSEDDAYYFDKACDKFRSEIPLTPEREKKIAEHKLVDDAARLMYSCKFSQTLCAEAEAKQKELDAFFAAKRADTAR
jgi:hypothetical protein